MDEDLRHIDLIDKYLNQNLKAEEQQLFEKLLREDPDFSREVDIYRKLYDGVAQHGHHHLKTRLSQYFQDYQEQTKGSQSKQRNMWMVLAVAASVALIAVAIFFNQTGQWFEQSQHLSADSSSRADSTQIEVPSPEPLAQGQKDNQQEPPLSLGGVTYLSPASVRIFQYSPTLRYTFTQDTLTIYGDPALPALSMEVLKTSDNRYLLKLRDRYYAIPETSVSRPLQMVSVNFSSSKPGPHQIMVKIAGLRQLSRPTSLLTVSITSQQSFTPTYFFEKRQGIVHLTIDGKIDPQATKAYVIKDHQETMYFLLTGSKLFALDTTATAPVPLREVNILTNEQTRQFRERAPFAKNLRLVE